MTVTHPGVVDWLGIEKETGHIVLTVVDDLDWTDESGHLSLLEEKLNTYLAFIESDEVFERLKALGRDVPRTTPTKVNILAKFPPSERARAFLEYARATFSGAGFELAFRAIAYGPVKEHRR